MQKADSLTKLLDQDVVSSIQQGSHHTVNTIGVARSAAHLPVLVLGVVDARDMLLDPLDKVLLPVRPRVLQLLSQIRHQCVGLGWLSVGRRRKKRVWFSSGETRDED